MGGVAEVVDSFSPHHRGSRAFALVGGLLGTLVGVLCLVYPGLSLVILFWLLGIWLVVYGVIQIIVALQLRKLSHP